MQNHPLVSTASPASVMMIFYDFSSPERGIVSRARATIRALRASIARAKSRVRTFARPSVSNRARRERATTCAVEDPRAQHQDAATGTRGDAVEVEEDVVAVRPETTRANARRT